MNDNLAAVLKSAEVLKAKALKATTVEEGSKVSLEFGVILKDLAKLQSDVGSLRSESNKAVGKLRRKSPKGAPVEGSTREIEGKTHIFTLGRYYPIAGEDQTVEK